MREWGFGPLLVSIILLAALGSGKGSASDAAPSPEDPAIAFPEGYRQWAHVKSALVWPSSPETEGFSGLHNIYANEEAMTGYRTGVFPDGAVIVFDLFDLEETDGALEPARRKSVDVMVRDPPGPGGWGFERFRGGRRTDRAGDAVRAACLSCHLSESQGDGVFSAFVE